MPRDDITLLLAATLKGQQAKHHTEPTACCMSSQLRIAAQHLEHHRTLSHHFTPEGHRARTWVVAGVHMWRPRQDQHRNVVRHIGHLPSPKTLLCCLLQHQQASRPSPALPQPPAASPPTSSHSKTPNTQPCTHLGGCRRTRAASTPGSASQCGASNRSSPQPRPPPAKP